jgi:hypothetical protein
MNTVSDRVLQKAKFKLGDLVKVIRDREADAYNTEAEWVGKEGKIIAINVEGNVLVYTILTDGLPPADPEDNEAWFCEDELELIS